MVVLRHRLAIAGVIAAAAIAVPAAALAAGSGSPPGKSGPPAAAAPSTIKSPPPGGPAPSSSPVPPAAAASKAAAAAGKPDEPAPISEFAAQLGVSVTAAGPAFKQVAGLAQTGSADPSSPAFAAIARELGVSPQRLAAAWAAVGSDWSSQGAAGK
jgi:hypothetical protein